ncbi:helix-turn-helix domain-containing protein [Paenibacillus sp. SI8]|uniref:helix-turn-helix domain-containing protein n=1 Tax=unclassified Paenibacillus TaxID=185978 RepID=UPI0034678E63
MMSLQRFNLISLHEATELLGISRSTFDRWRKLKQLPFVKIGKEILIDKTELEKWVRYHSFGIQQPAFAMGSTSMMMPQRPSVITVGYQSGTAHMWTALIMRELGWFEEELAKAGSGRTIQVRWIDAANGPVLLQGLIGGSIQIASLGDYPILLSYSLSQTLPAFRPILLALDGKTSGGQGISLVVRKGLEIHRASEISSMKISTVAQSSASCRLLKLLHSLGGHKSQIEHKEMDESMAGIVQRHISGSAMWEPYLSLVQYHGAGQVLYQEGLGEDYLTGIVADENWASNNQADTLAYLKAHLRVHTFMRRDPGSAAKLIARSKGIPAEVAARIIAKVRWDAALYAKDLRSLYLLKSEDDRNVSGVGAAYNEISYKGEYLNQAIEELQLPKLNGGVLKGDWDQEQIY